MTARRYPRILSIDASDPPPETEPTVVQPPPPPLPLAPARPPTGERHATIVQLGGQPWVAEVWSPDELDRLPVGDRPMMTYVIPGIGHLGFRMPGSVDEIEAIRAAAQSASTRMRLDRGRK